MAKPLVSIIIPCYNSESFIGDAIESALMQTYSNTEIIVIDDGSTDKSRDVIHSFGKHVIYQYTSNKGANAARNRGLQIANGEIIQFLDADDELDPKKLELMVPIAVSHGRGTVPVCDWKITALDGSVVGQRKLGYDGRDPFVFELFNHIPTNSALYWKNDIFEIGCLDEWLPCSQDLDWNLKLMSKGCKIIYIPKFLFTVKRRKESISNDYIKVMDQHIGIVSRLLNTGNITNDRRKALAEFIARDASPCGRNGSGQRGRILKGVKM